jgi:uncharacterized membrane protein YwzB
MFLIILIGILLSATVSYLIFQYVKDDKLLRTVTQTGRGTWSERDLIIRLLKSGIPSKSIYHDLYVKKNDGSYSQVDLVVVTEVGIVVIEVKKYSGWIYGVGDRKNWVQVLAYGKEKYSLYNPIFQNDGHIRTIKNSLPNYLNVPFHSMIVFYGDCKLKKISNVPSDVLVVKANKAIDTFNDIILKCPITNFYTKEVVTVLKKGVENGNDLEIQNVHVQNVENRLNRILN